MSEYRIVGGECYFGVGVNEGQLIDNSILTIWSGDSYPSDEVLEAAKEWANEEPGLTAVTTHPESWYSVTQHVDIVRAPVIRIDQKKRRPHGLRKVYQSVGSLFLTEEPVAETENSF